MSEMATDTNALARGTLKTLSDERLVLGIPGTSYEVHLVPSVPAARITTPVGRRIKGTVEAEALRIHPARGGGRFIEPLIGEPRIVAGTVLAIDPERRRVLLDVALPMWVTWQDGQDLDVLREGHLVNCHVRSGATFTPEGSSP